MSASSKKNSLHFDPYEILNLKRGCTDDEINRGINYYFFKYKV